MKSRTRIRRVCLAVLAVAVCFGATGEEADDRSALEAHAARLQGALVSCRDPLDPRKFNLGCFIDDEGTAVFHISAFATERKRRFALKDGTTLKPPRLLHIEPTYGIAFVDFGKTPRLWIEPRREPVPLKSDLVGILTVLDRPQVIVGPVWGRCHAMSAVRREPSFHKVMLVASGLPVADPGIGTGCPVIDAQGRLCGLFDSGRPLGSINELSVAPSDCWIGSVAIARDAAQAIPIPVPEALNPFDPAHDHADYARAMQAATRQQWAKAAKHVEAALKDHPDSTLLKNLQFDLAAMAGSGDLRELMAGLDPGENATPAEKAVYLMSVAKADQKAGDLKRAVERYREAIELVPEDYSSPHFELSECLETSGDLEGAIRHARQAVAGSAVNLPALERLNLMLIRAGRFDEAKEVEEEVWRLEPLFAPILR